MVCLCSVTLLQLTASAPSAGSVRTGATRTSRLQMLSVLGPVLDFATILDLSVDDSLQASVQVLAKADRQERRDPVADHLFHRQVWEWTVGGQNRTFQIEKKEEVRCVIGERSPFSMGPVGARMTRGLG